MKQFVIRNEHFPLNVNQYQLAATEFNEKFKKKTYKRIQSAKMFIVGKKKKFEEENTKNNKEKLNNGGEGEY